MVWGLDKLWPSGSTNQPGSKAPTSEPASSISSASTAPLVTATITPGQSPLQPQNAPSTTTTLSPALVQSLKQEEDSSRDWFSARSRKQFGLFAAGAAFLLLTQRMTRRQLAKRALTKPPPFKHNDSAADISVNGPMEAVEALSIATMNVLSFSMMMTGGLLWAFDISTLDDLRRKIRGGLGVDGTGRNTDQVEEEFEEWLATVLDRKKLKEEKLRTEKGVADYDEVKEHWRNERGKPRGA